MSILTGRMRIFVESILTLLFFAVLSFSGFGMGAVVASGAETEQPSDTSVLLPGTELNVILSSDADYSPSSIYFGRKSDYRRFTNRIHGVPVDKNRLGTIELYRAKANDDTYVYILSDSDNIYANPDASSMFKNLGELKYISLENLLTDFTTNMSNMFAMCYKLKKIDGLSGFTTSSVTDMSSMFFGCICLDELDVRGFDTSSVNSMKGMFYNCYCLAILDLSSFDTSNVTDMSGMFSFCGDLITLDLSGFKNTNVRDFSNMFSGCHLLFTVYVSDEWGGGKLGAKDNNMFIDCYSIIGGSYTVYDSSHTSKEYARIDDPTMGKPGYFTRK